MLSKFNKKSILLLCKAEIPNINTNIYYCAVQYNALPKQIVDDCQCCLRRFEEESRAVLPGTDLQKHLASIQTQHSAMKANDVFFQLLKTVLPCIYRLKLSQN